MASPVVRYVMTVLLATLGLCDSDVGPLEICERETFLATCNADQVISIGSAEYGRMRLGRCVSKDYGLVGCAVDVTGVLERLCSGQRKCEVSGSHPLLVDAKTKACDKDLAAYLVVTYKCLKVATGSRRSCTSKGYNTLPPSSGRMSVNQAAQGGFGGRSCPWRLQPTSGQQYNITMTTYGAVEGAVECLKVLEVQEGDQHKDVLLCATDTTSKTVYVTKGKSSVDFVIMTDELGPDRRVILSYEALECEDPSLPNQASFSRRNSGEGQITCKESGRAWNVHCEDRQWKGSVGTCGGQTIFGTTNQSPYTFLIIVVVGTVVGMLLGGALLGLLIVCIRRCRKWKRRKRQRAPSFRFDDYLTYTSHMQKTALWNDLPTRTPHNWLDLTSATLPRADSVPSRPDYASLPRDVTLRRSSYASLPREPPIDPRAPHSERQSLASRDLLPELSEGEENARPGTEEDSK